MAVEVTGPADIHGSFVSQGITFYGWTFPVVVNGEAGVYTVWEDTNNPADEPAVSNDAVQDLTNNPGLIQPISQNDPTNQGNPPDGDDRGSDDDDDDEAVADGTGLPGDGDSA